MKINMDVSPLMHFNKLIPELVVSDLAVSLAFYVGKLDFAIKYERKEDKFAFIEKEGSQLMLEELRNDSWIVGKPIKHPYGQGINFQIEIGDVDALYDSLCAKGHNFFLELEEKWYQCGDKKEGNRQFIIQDPDGYLLRFCSGLGYKSEE